MVICTVEVNEKSPQTIVIGRRGTYNTQEIVFDIGYLIDAYGAGTAVLAIKRSQDSSAYPTVVTQEDTTLTWTVSETDTYYVGAGECQLMWYVDGGLAKTIIYPLVVMRDILSTSEEAPDAYQTWVDDLTALGAETLENAQNADQSASDAESAKDDAVTAKEAAEEAAEKAEEASVHAPVIQGGYWYIWNNGQYVNTGVQAEGQKGDKGDPGEKGETGNGIASITKTGTSGLVDTYTVTYTDGTTTTFTVTNGAKGDKGDTGATGNGIQSITKTGTSGNVDTYTITYTNGQTTTFTVTNGAVSSVAGKTGVVTLDANDVAFSESGAYDDGTVGKELSNQKNAINQKAPVIINTASGDIATFADGADGMQIRKIVGTIVPQQADGTPSPDNPLPISGWTGANIYNEETYDASATPKLTINWQSEAGTIYGGTVTLNEDGSADVVSDRALITITGEEPNSSFKIGSSTQGYIQAYLVPDVTIVRSSLHESNYGPFSNLLRLTSSSQGFINYALYEGTTVSYWNNSIVFRVLEASSNPTVADTKAEIVRLGGIQVVAYLATPQTYHFADVGELYTYFGTNNIWIDTGSITECDYPADTKLYIDGLTAPDEDMIANANIESGKYFVVNNQLYLSTAAIAAGASIIPGTNCTATNLAEALNAINT